MYFSDTLPVAAALLAFTGMIWFLVNLLTRQVRKSAVLVSIFLSLMFSYQNLIYGINVLYVVSGANEWILKAITNETFLVVCFLFELFVMALITVKVIQAKTNFKSITRVLNVYSVFLVLVVFVSWLIPEAARTSKTGSLIDPFTSRWENFVQDEPCLLKKDAVKTLPDIYVILLDGYGRDDILRQMYGLDNTGFISELENRGFYVARNARSNYRHTELTMGSLFNYDYFESLANKTGLDVLNTQHFGPFIHDNRAVRQLKCLGYSFITLESGYYYTEFRDNSMPVSVGTYPSRFAIEFTDSTPLTIPSLQIQYNTERARMRSTIETLRKIPQDPSPKLVYAHIMAGHDPFVFGPNGETVNPPRVMRFDSAHEFTALANRPAFEKGYRDQVTFISKEMLSTVDQLIAGSNTPPVILMFGDHGPSMRLDIVPERMSIFNSYYFPGGDYSSLSPDISPVNSMRAVFNTFFGTNLDMLPYTGNFAADNDLYKTMDVTRDIPDNPYIQTAP
jgi:hypothetical protein